MRGRRLHTAGGLTLLLLLAGAGPLAAPASAATACVEGDAMYATGTAFNDVNKPLRGVGFNVMDAEDHQPDERVTTGVTDAEGHYRVCFNNADGFGQGGRDIYLSFHSGNGIWDVVPAPGRARLSFKSAQRDDVSGTRFIPTAFPRPQDFDAFELFDTVYDAWRFAGDGSTAHHCWNGATTPGCADITVAWNPTARWEKECDPDHKVDRPLSCYSSGTRTAFIDADDAADVTVVGHELGHGVMHLTYGRYPQAPEAEAGRCVDHRLDTDSGAVCAWTEGWATWFGLRAYNTTRFGGPNGTDMESPSWFNGWDTGTTVEGRIATALLDISDRPQAAEWSWDRVGDGDAAVWAAFRRQPVDTWDQFADLLRAEVDGQSLAATLYENTLAGARSFTDPLVDGGEVTRPAYGPVESYRFGVSGGRWAAAAVRPGAAVNKNLYMFDSVGGSALKLSAASGSDVDFVPLSPARSGEHEAWAIFDGNGVDRRRAGQYQIEYAEGPELARGSAETVHLGEQDVLVVRGVELTEHVRTLLGVSIVSGSPDVEVFLVRDLETRDEVPADRQAPSPGFGGTRWVDVTPATGEGGSYGLVVVNRAGAGEVELRYF